VLEYQYLAVSGLDDDLIGIVALYLSWGMNCGLGCWGAGFIAVGFSSSVIMGVEVPTACPSVPLWPGYPTAVATSKVARLLPSERRLNASRIALGALYALLLAMKSNMCVHASLAV
jgi:hypothetical protein